MPAKSEGFCKFHCVHSARTCPPEHHMTIKIVGRCSEFKPCLYYDTNFKYGLTKRYLLKVTEDDTP